MPESPFDTEKDAFVFFQDALRHSWDRYLTVTTLAGSLSGGTILIFLNGLFVAGKDRTWDGMWLGISALVLAGVALVASLAWRVASQTLMDREIFGPAEIRRAYFRACGFSPASDYEGIYGNEAMMRFYQRLFIGARYLSPTSLILSWIATSVFLLRNIGGPG